VKKIFIEVDGYEICFIRKGQKIKMIGYLCPTKSYGDPYLPRHIYKEALKKIKKNKK